MQINPSSPSVASHFQLPAATPPVDVSHTAVVQNATAATSPANASGAAPTAPAALQPSDVDAVVRVLDPQEQGVQALLNVLLRRYAFDPVTLQMHRAQAAALVKPWGLQARVQEVVRKTDPAALATLAEALSHPQVQSARAKVEMVVNMLGVPLPEKPNADMLSAEPDLQLLHKLSPTMVAQAQNNPAVLEQARQFIHQSMPAGAVARALEWLDNPAYVTLVELERATAKALEGASEAPDAADVLARQVAPAQLQQCDEVLKVEPHNSAARRLRADLAAKIEGKHDEAIADLTDVLEHDGLEGDYANRATSYAAQGDWSAAEQDLGRAALFSVGNDESLKAYLKMALRGLTALYPAGSEVPLELHVRRATLGLAVEGLAAVSAHIAALQQAAPDDPRVCQLVALAETYREAEVVAPPAAAITPTPLESDVGPITGQPMVVRPVFTRLAARLDVTTPLIARSLNLLQEEFSMFPEVVAQVRTQLLSKAPELAQTVAEALQQLCSPEDAHAIEGMLNGPAGALVCQTALPLGERVHTALKYWLQDIGGAVSGIQVPRDLRNSPLRQLLQALDPEAAAGAGGAFGVQCDDLARQLQQTLAPQDLQTLLALAQTKPFTHLSAAYRHINEELFVALRQTALGEALLPLSAAQRDASNTRLAADPDDVAALAGRAMAGIALNDQDNTEGDLNRLLELAPTARNYRRRALWNLMCNQPAAALADAQAAVRLAPRSSQSYIMRSQTHLAAGSLPEALQDSMHARLLAVSAEESLQAQAALGMAYQQAQTQAATAGAPAAA